MRTPTILSFDCAHTLVDARWDPGLFAVTCAENVGIPVHRDDHAYLYRAQYVEWLPRFHAVNLTRDVEQVRAFWREFTEYWLTRIGWGLEATGVLMEEADLQMYGSDRWFELYDDVIPTLNDLEIASMRKAILSNWDISLHRVVESKGISGYFDPIIASLEEGPEKPDPALFQILLDRLGAEPQDVMHIGDNPEDDLIGAQRVGMHACLINRTLKLSKPQVERVDGLIVATISSLTQIPEVLKCTT
jgi:HAD superfamily hydrolase (TIGR01549 family)